MNDFEYLKNIYQPDLFKGKVALVTGGATGICYGMAKAYLMFGATVVIASRKEEVLKNSVEKLKQET